MLFKKLLIFGLLLVVIEQLFYEILLKKKLPVFWGNEEIAGKIDYVTNHPEINTVFIGSSKVKTQVLPNIFDSITNKQTNTFNLGCNGLFIPESFILLNYLINNSNLKNILYEFRPVYHIYKENLHITRTIYYHTIQSYLATIQNTYFSNLPLVRKLNAYSTFTVAEIENLLNFNFIEGFVNYKNHDVARMAKIYDKNKGCFTMGDEPGEALINSHQELDKRANLSINYMSRFNNDTTLEVNYNQVYLEEMQKIIQRAAYKKVNLILIFPTALREFEYREILPLLKELKNTPQIIIADAAKYPALYEVKYNFETDHLNTKGAKLYSIELGKAFNNLKNN